MNVVSVMATVASGSVVGIAVIIGESDVSIVAREEKWNYFLLLLLLLLLMFNNREWLIIENG